MSKAKISLIVALLTIIILTTNSVLKKKELANNGVRIPATVQEYSYVKYLTNPEGGNPVEFHRVVYQYYFEGESYISNEELQPQEYFEYFPNRIDKGDTITVTISRKTPSNSIIEIQIKRI